MGIGKSQSFNHLDLQKDLHIYVLGFPQDIIFKSDNPQVQKVLDKLRKYTQKKMYIFRLKKHIFVDFLKQHAKGMMAAGIVKRLQQNEQKVGIIGFIRLNQKCKITVNELISFWRSKDKANQTQSLMLLNKKRILQAKQQIQWFDTWKQTQQNLISMAKVDGFGA